MIPGLSVSKACGFLGISRQAYYQQYARQIARDGHEAKVLAFVRTERMMQPRIGTRKLKYMMAQQGLLIGRDHLFNLLGVHRLLVPAKRAYHRTTLSHHRLRCHPNLLAAQMPAKQPEQVWVADITYFPTWKEDTYISLVTDAFSRKIVGYYVDNSMHTGSVKQAFRQALRQRMRKEGLIHHSDRGSQYCSKEYQALHAQHGVKCSMTDGYDCYQNALAERINGILKNEFLLTKPQNLEEARKMVEESVLIYNQRRPHLALQYKTPDEVHRAF